MRMMRHAPIARRDILPTTDPAVSEALFHVFLEQSSLVEPARRDKQRQLAQNSTRYSERIGFVEPLANDPTGYERVIGESDLTSINYMDRGRRAANSVCRIRVPEAGGEWYGTAFLAGPRLLVTNHHVLGSASEASRAEAEFGYEHDIDGVLIPPTSFNLAPHELFFTSAALDITFVAVSPISDAGVPLDRYGWLALLPLSGKSIDREWITIIQHPGGGPKQISIRSSRIAELSAKAIGKQTADRFIHYLTDTEPGSSGSPVVNDQWQVVAVHHKAVPAPAKKSEPKIEREEDVKYIGNEGIRVSAIFSMLEQMKLENDQARRVLDRLEAGLGLPPVTMLASPAAGGEFEREAKAFEPKRWKLKAGIGYDSDFLPGVPIDLQQIYAQHKEDKHTAPLLTGGGDELKYNHFSVIVHKARKFALLTAVNIMGKRLDHPGPRNDAWRIDPRMAPEYQPAANFYVRSKGTDKVQFSRGHLVRRFDPCWGSDDTVKKAEEDTFHYVNAAPQFQKFNDVDWGNLEDYVLDRAQVTEAKMSVFTGPIFSDRDPVYGRNREGGPWRIPVSYWKIAVLDKGEGNFSAAAFIVGQTQYIKALYEAKVFAGLKPYRMEDLRSRGIQTTVATIEQETGLDFSAIRDFDSQGSLEATRRTRWINRLDDILI